MNRVYRWYFHFNASHNMLPSESNKRHVHTFLVVASIEVTKMDLAKQNACGDAFGQYLSGYSGQYLNDMEVFAGKIPTVEGICEILYRDMKQIAEKYEAELLNLETGDSPVAMFSMGEQLLVGSTYQPVSDEVYQAFIERQMKE